MRQSNAHTQQVGKHASTGCKRALQAQARPAAAHTPSRPAAPGARTCIMVPPVASIGSVTMMMSSGEKEGGSLLR